MPHRLLIRKAEQLGLFAPRPPSTREAVKDVKHVFPGAKEVAPQKPILPRPGPLKPQKLTPGVLRSSAPGVRYHAVIRRGRTVIWKSPRNDYTREEAYDVAEARYAPREQEVKRPGSRGGIGYFDAHGVWRYGDRPGTVPPVEPPPVPPPSEPAVDVTPAVAAETTEPPPASTLPPPPPPPRSGPSIKLSPAQVSAFEIEEPGLGSYGEPDLDRGMELLRDHLDIPGERLYLPSDPADLELMRDAVTHISNSNDAQAEDKNEDPQMRQFARRAAVSASVVSGKLIEAEHRAKLPAAIDKLVGAMEAEKQAPEPPAPEPPPPAPPAAPPTPPAGGEGPRYDPTGKDVPDGRYAVPSRTGRNDLDFYNVETGSEHGRYAGQRFVQRVLGGGQAFNVGRAEAADAFVRIQHYGVLDSLRRYGEAMGVCGKCGLPLTDETSRALGIGPKCRGDMGMDAAAVKRALAAGPRDPNMPDRPELPPPPPPPMELPPPAVPVEPPTPKVPESVEREDETAVDALRDELRKLSIRLVPTKDGRLAMQGNTYAHYDRFKELKTARLIRGDKHEGNFAWFLNPDDAITALGYFNGPRQRRIFDRTGTGSTPGIQPGQGDAGGAGSGEGGLATGQVPGVGTGSAGRVVQPQAPGYSWDALTRMSAEELQAIGPPAPVTPLDPSLSEVVEGTNQLDVQLIADAWNRGDKAFLLGSATGTGKTYVTLGVIKQLKQPRTLIVVPSQGVAEQWAKAATEEFGMPANARLPRTKDEPGIFITTYAMLTKDERLPEAYGRWGLFVPDEVHLSAMKLAQKRPTAVMVNQFADNAKLAIYSTASPYEAPQQVMYLRNLGLWPQFKRGAWHEWAENHGVHFEQKYIPGKYEPVTVPVWRGTRESKLLDMLRIRAEIVGAGKGVFRELKVDQPLTSDFQVTHAHAGEYGDVVRRAIRAIADLSSAAIRTNITKRLLDYVKIDDAVDRAVAAVQDGKRVVMMVSHKAPFRFEDPEADADLEVSSKVREEMLDLFAQAGLKGELPAPTTLLKEKVDARLGRGASELYHGAVPKAQRKSRKDKFNAGKLPVLISTIAAGGTGLSLHDTKGDAPRHQINIGLPWTGRDLMQMLGRTYRKKVASPVHQTFLWTDHPREKRIAAVVGGRLEALNAGVSGITTEKNTDKLAEFSIRGKDIEDDIEDESSADELRKAHDWTF